jgi:hypothetical protein
MAKIKDIELQEVLQAVAADLEASYKAEKEALLKALPEESAEELPVSPSATPASSDSDSAPAASPAEAPAASPAPEAHPDVPGEEGEAPLSAEALAAEYAQLPPEEFAMHLQAIEMAQQAMAAQGASPASNASPPAAPPPAAASPSAPPEAMKSEVPAAGSVAAQGASHEKASGGQEEQGKEMSKSEPKFAELEALVKSQAAELANVGKILEHMLARPERKSITSIAELAKSEPEPQTFTPAEVKKKLFDLIPSLSKSERAVVLDYYDGRASLSAMKPILAKIQ